MSGFRRFIEERRLISEVKKGIALLMICIGVAILFGPYGLGVVLVVAGVLKLIAELVS